MNLSNGAPLLTIAIPTHNRARFLRELLHSVEEQIKHEPDVELIISDNASTDETSTVAQEFAGRGIRSKYLRSSENLGADANFLNCFERASGKYVWIIGDDDLIVPGGIEKVLTHLRANRFDLVYVNSYSFSEDNSVGPKAGRRGAIEFTDPAGFARRVNVFFSFISGNIVNRESVLENAGRELRSLVGTSLVQLGWTYRALDGLKRGLYIDDQLIGMRVGNTGGYKVLDVFGNVFQSITDQWLSSTGVKRGITNGTILRFWPGILLMYKKSGDRFTKEAGPASVLTPVFGNNLRYWVFAYPIILFPYSLAKLWFLLVRIINRIDKAAGFALLR